MPHVQEPLHAGNQGTAARRVTDLDTPGAAYLQRLLAQRDGTTPPPVAAAINDNLYLPDTFWTARPYLTIIAAAAYAHLASPDAVLHTILARTAAFAGRSSGVDAGLGRAPLNYFTALLAPSGVGKTVATGVADRLLPAPELDDHQPPLDGIPIGSGEGMAEAYMGDVKQTNGKGRPVTVREQVRWGVYFDVDEGEVLGKLLHERQGSTLGVNLRIAWSGKPLGQANATAERTRRVTKYSMGVTIGFQPHAIAPLIREAPLGTPQRFTYALARPQHVPGYDQRAEWSPTTIQPPGWGRQWRVTCEEPIRAEVYQQRVTRSLGITTVDPLDTHEPVMLMKIAGLLTILDGRQRATTDDWNLARTIWNTSRRVRTWAINQLDHERDAEETRVAEARGRQVVIVNEAVRHSSVDRVARLMHKYVTLADEPLQIRDLRMKLNSRDKDAVNESLMYAVEQGWINRIPPIAEGEPQLFADGPNTPPSPPRGSK